GETVIHGIVQLHAGGPREERREPTGHPRPGAGGSIRGEVADACRALRSLHRKIARIRRQWRALKDIEPLHPRLEYRRRFLDPRFLADRIAIGVTSPSQGEQPKCLKWIS